MRTSLAVNIHLARPHPVDNGWGQHCGTLRSVMTTSTAGRPCLSTGGRESRWKTGGCARGLLGKLSHPRPSVDVRTGKRPRRAPVLHAIAARLTWDNSGYPQCPQALRRRWVFSLQEDSVHARGVDAAARKFVSEPGWRDRRRAGQNQTFRQEASHEVSG